MPAVVGQVVTQVTACCPSFGKKTVTGQCELYLPYFWGGWELELTSMLSTKESYIFAVTLKSQCANFCFFMF